MEAAIQQVLHNSFGDYVEGLEKIQINGFPLALNNLKLKEKEIQKEMDEDGGTPFDLKDGMIGNITIKPGWIPGNIEVVATNIVLNLSFNPMKAMRRAMQPDELEEPESPQQRGYGGYPQQQPQARAPPPDTAPRFCRDHDSSEKRVKGPPTDQQCQRCRTTVKTSYEPFTYCPPCSEMERQCMICGKTALKPGNYVPANQVNQNPPEGAGCGGCGGGGPGYGGGGCGGGGPSYGGDRDLAPPEPPRGGPRGQQGPNSFRNQGNSNLPPPPPQGFGDSRNDFSRNDLPAPPPPLGTFDGGGSNYGASPGQDSGYNRDPYRGQGQPMPPSPTGQYGASPGGLRDSLGGAPPQQQQPAFSYGAPPMQNSGYPPYGDRPPANQYGPPGQAPYNQQSTTGPGGRPTAFGGAGSSLDDAHKAIKNFFDFNAWGKTCNNDNRMGQPGGSYVDNTPQPYGAGRAY